MSVSQAVGLQPWRHFGLREKAGAGNVGEGLISTMPPRGDDVLAGGLRPQPHSDPEAALQEGEFGAGFGPPSSGGAATPKVRNWSSDSGRNGGLGGRFFGQVLTPNRGLKMRPEIKLHY